MQRGVVESPSSSERVVLAEGGQDAGLAPAAGSDLIIGALGLSPRVAERLKRATTDRGVSPVVAASILGLASDEAIAQACADLYQCPLWPQKVTAHESPPEVSREYLRERFAVVLAQDDARVAIGLVDPSDQQVRSGLAFAISRRLEFFTVPFSAWRDVHGELHSIEMVVEGASLPALQHQWANDAERLNDFERDAPVARAVDRLFERAVLASASDIHVEQKSDHTQVRFRIDGELRSGEQLPLEIGPTLLARVKVLADLDVAARRTPQDGRTTVTVRGEPIDVRISTTPTAYGESLVVRLLRRQTVSFDLDDLGFSKHIGELLNSMLAAPHGLVLVTGPTGSGKTTTLYAALRRLVKQSVKILTIEDPIEYIFEDINQTQVNEAAGVTFASALRSFLRHDPDVILVGEIRDTETARLAVQAALTGHLVLATLHTNDAPSAVARLVDMGVERYLLAGVLVGVMAQRLSPALCRRCHDASSARAGCPACGGAGRVGRAPIGEAFRSDGELEQLVVEGASTGRLHQFLAEQRGFRTMREDGLQKAATGEIAREDALRITQA
jgi:general secretion pathway protein E